MGYKLEQQQYIRDKPAQPPPILTRPTTTHLIPATQQLGLTQEETEEVPQDQEDGMGDEERWEEKGEYTTEVTHHQQRDRHDGAPLPNTTIGHSEPAPGLCETSHKDSDDDALSYDSGPLDPELAPRVLYQPPTPILDGADPTP
ncbi:hypothetical protein PILCRDRAFT_13438 [Piloderma croceum F 1598]|uniref:Uncharacterized protein n=1 Tax=Piloderma croceum (strain F 1598) TaxID=765440 RepID=A0A0C3F6W4_PILCF|nr:hypothetical protein PILCRDRAFT_13438 [Piloderma croceum F 1598]